MPPEFCLIYLYETQTLEDGELVGEVGAVYFGETVYHPTTYGYQTREWVDEMNLKLGHSLAYCYAMATCSMFNRWKHFDTILKSLEDNLHKGEENGDRTIHTSGI